MSARKKAPPKHKKPKPNYRVWETGEERPAEPNIWASDPEEAAMIEFESPGWGDYAGFTVEDGNGVQHHFKLRVGQPECRRVR